MANFPLLFGHLKGGKRTQTVMGQSIVAHTATKITGSFPKGRAANLSPTHIGYSPIRASASTETHPKVKGNVEVAAEGATVVR